MIERFKKSFHVEIKEAHKEDFAEELKMANNIRTQVVLYAIGIVLFFWFVPSIYLKRSILSETFFALIVVLCIVLLNIFKNTKFISYLHIFIISICLMWAQHSNFSGDTDIDNFTPYLIGVLAFATIPYVKPLHSAIILGINQMVFLFVSYRLAYKYNFFIDTFANFTLFAIFAWAISVFHYNAFVNNYLNGVLVEELNIANKKLEDYMRIDVGTGISNRLAFEEILKIEWERSKRSLKGISLAMIDIDFFKQYNDNYGHSKGDICLKNVAQCISDKMSRASDFAGRYGGEEFVIIMPEADEETAFIHAERIRSAVEELKIEHKSRPDGVSFVSISLGLATICPKKDEISSDLVEKADAALYRAKNNGRNRIEVSK